MYVTPKISNYNFNNKRSNNLNQDNKINFNFIDFNRKIMFLPSYNLSVINFKGNIDSKILCEAINNKNINEVMPLYSAYRENMGQKVEEAALFDFIINQVRTLGTKIFILKLSGKPEGFIHTTTSYSTIDLTPFGMIEALFVNADKRRAGCSSALIQCAKDWVVLNNYKGLKVKTLVTNTPGIKTYITSGFNDETAQYATFFWPNTNVLKTYKDKKYIV